MSYTGIVNLLICAKIYNNANYEEVAENLEFVEENIDELKYLGNLTKDYEKKITELLDMLGKFFELGNRAIDLVIENDLRWCNINKTATEILNLLEIKIVDPDIFIERYNWNDGEQWDGKKGKQKK